MKVKVSKASGGVLDYMVAICKGLPLKLDPMGFREHYPDSIVAGWWVWYGADQGMVVGHRNLYCGREQGYSPSTDWAQGGPIIEREIIQILPMFNPEGWSARVAKRSKWLDGPTPLIAAMRCYVTSKLGEEIEVPDELLKT